MVDAQEAFPAEPNGQFPFASEAVRRAASAGEFDTVRRLVREGAELNVFDRYGDSLLEEIVTDLLNEPDLAFQSSDMVRLLLDLGADPNLMQPNESVALVPAMLHMDMPMLKVLLENGANPNPSGRVCDGSNIYDWADFDYWLEVWSLPGNGDLLKEHSKEDLASEDAWLEFLDRAAIQHGVRRPDHLMLLRQYGAKSKHELEGSDVEGQIGPRSALPRAPITPKSSVLPPERDLEDAKGFLSILIRDGWDWLDQRLPIHLEALHNQHCNDPAFMALFEQAAHVYSDSVVERAKEALRTMGSDHEVS